MAHRIDSDNRAIDLFGAGKDGYATPSPPTVPPTTMTPAHANFFQEEICNAVEAAGLTLVKADNTQLTQAIIELASNNIAIANWSQSEGASGFVGSLIGLAYDGTTYVACGTDGEIQTSADIVNWTRRTADASYIDDFAAAATDGAGTFVIVGAAAGVQYSTDDGATWTAVTLPGAYTADVSAVTWDGTRFIAVGRSSGIFTSADGITWTARTPGSSYSGHFISVAASGSLIVALGTAVGGFHNEVQTSSDGGVTWTRRHGGGAGVSGLGNQSIGYGNGIFVASGSGNALIHKTADGITWTSHTLPSAVAATMRGIAYDGARYFVALGEDAGQPVVYTSTNGTVWTRRRVPLAPSIFPEQLLFDGSAFIAGTRSNAVVTSLRLE